MIFEQEYRIRLEDVGTDGVTTDKAIMTIMEDVGSLHSDAVGYGMATVLKTQKVWIVLDWKIEIKNRPVYGAIVKARTWARKNNKVCAYRDFEITDKDGNILAAGTSRWIYMDLERRKPLRLTDEMIAKYQGETDRQALETDIENPSYARDYFQNKTFQTIPYRVLRRDIDSNGHMHNINYLDAAYEMLPQDVYLSHDWQNIRIFYKKEIMYGQEIICKYTKEADKHVVVFMDTEDTVHAIIELS